jgi:hypothetical protein
MTPGQLEDVGKLLRAQFAEEANAGFPKLGRVPSSNVVRFLDYLGHLTRVDRDALLDTLARVASLNLRPLPIDQAPILAIAGGDPALLRYRAAVQEGSFAMGLRYQSLRMVRAMLGDPETVAMMAATRAHLGYEPRDDMPTALVADPDRSHVVPARAPLLRSLVDREMKRLFATSRRRLPGGETGYEGELDGTPITVWIDYAGMDLQLRYAVTIPDPSRRVLVFRVAYENLWGSGGGWDYLTEQNAEASLGHLGGLVSEIVRLRNRVLELL